MESCRRLCNWAYRGLVGSPYERWYFPREDLDREKTSRLAQELVDSIKSIFWNFDNLDQFLENELKKTSIRLIREDRNTLLKVFEILEEQFKSIQTLQQTNEENEYTLSKRVKSQECLKTLLDKETRFGQKLVTIKDYCRPEDQRYVIVNLTINFELGIENYISKLNKICNILRKSKLGCLPMNVLVDESSNIKREISTYGQNATYTDVCRMLEEMMIKLRPICNDFNLKMSKMATALERKFQVEDN